MRWFFYGWGIGLLFTVGAIQAQVNFQKGAAEVNIPLYSFSDAGNRLGVNAALVYIDGNGLKVSEMASSVGTGWNLDFGGVITRRQNGAPDDQYQPGTYSYTSLGYSNYMESYYPNGYLYSEYQPSDNINNIAAYTPYTTQVPMSKWSYKMRPEHLADREQDVFTFTFNGRVGEFVIGKNKMIRTLNDSKLKIELTETDMSGNNVRTRISQFTITDESGIQYVFKDRELDYVCTYNNVWAVGDRGTFDPNGQSPNYSPPSNANCPGCFDQTSFVITARVTNQFVVNKWYLSEINNPFTNKKITFNYTIFEEDVNCDKVVNYSPTSDGHSAPIVYWQKYKAKALRLSSVVLSSNERVDLVYASSPRVDLPNQRTLDKILVSYGGKPVYGWSFTYGYFIGNAPGGGQIKSPQATFTNEEVQWARLALLSLQKTGLNNSVGRPYQFAYYMGGGSADNGGNLEKDYIPPMFSIFQDHYGYYSGGRYGGLVPESSASSWYGYVTLRGVAQLAGNKEPYGRVAKNGILKTITYPTGGTLTYTYAANGSAQRWLGGVKVASTTQSDGTNPQNDIVRQYNYVNPDQTSSAWGSEDHLYSRTTHVTATVCSQHSTGAFQVRDMAFNYVYNGFLTGNFSLASALSSMGFTGDLFSTAISIAITIIIDLFSSGDYEQDIVNYTSISTISGNPLPWGYARVEVVNKLSPDDIGSTVYEFSSPSEHAIEIPTQGVPYSNRPRYGTWAYGALKSVTVYDRARKLVRKSVNSYSYIVTPLADNNFLSKSWYATKPWYACGGPPYTPNPNTPNDGIAQETYYPLTGRTVLNSTDEYVYNAQQQAAVTTTNYEYDANFQLKRKYFNNSKGEQVETLYYYTYDYCINTGALSVMNASGNVISPIVSAETYITKSDGKYLINATTTDFGFIGNGDIKPRKIYTFQSMQPLPASSSLFFNCSSLIKDPASFKQIALYDYDSSGNLVQTLSGGNKLAGTIYDYDGKLPAASVANASYNDIGYTSFEAEGGKPGSWVNTAAIIADDARTGSRCFNLSDPSNSTGNYFGFGGLNNSLTYIVSFWGKNSSACIKGYAGTTNTINSCQGTSGWTQGVTVNGWTYYEMQVSGVDKIGMSGTGLLDEFRVYPAGSQMMTTTYAPLIGKTSECDASGRVTYYLYDDLGRLIKVSDDARNVIRSYEYNFKQ